MTQKQTTNSLPKTIKNIDDVWSFFSYLHIVDSLLFHPEEEFKSYINGETDKPTFTAIEAKKRNILMEKCFQVCAEHGVNIFDVAMESCNVNIFDEKSSNPDVAVCTKSVDYVYEETGEVVGFSKNKFYQVVREDSIWVSVMLKENDEYLKYTIWDFEKHFRYAEDWEAEGFKEKLWDSL